MEGINGEKIEKWVHRWGCSISEAVLDPACQFFHVPNIDGLIGYRLESNCAVIYGDPICAPNDMPLLAEAFHLYCQERKRNIIYVSASEGFAKWAIDHLCSIMIEVGEEVIFDPQVNCQEGPKGSRLRNKISHAHMLGLSVAEYLTYDTKLEQAIQQIGAAWLQAREGPQIYLGHLNFFENRMDKRWFYIKQGEHILGIALLSRLEARAGWLLKFLISVPNSPRGTSELLMTSVLEILRSENCHFLTYGMVPADQLGKIAGLGKFSSWLAQCAFNAAKWIFKLDQRRIYWQKFHPKTEPSYIVFCEPRIRLQEIRALMKSLKIDL